MKNRLNLVLTDQSKKRLDRLIGLTEADTSAEVIRNALRLYEALINRVLSDDEFLVRNKKTGEISIYEIFDTLGAEVAQPPTRPPDRTRVRQKELHAS